MRQISTELTRRKAINSQFARVYPKDTRGLVKYGHRNLPQNLITCLRRDVVTHHHVVALYDVSRDTKRLAAYNVPQETQGR